MTFEAAKVGTFGEFWLWFTIGSCHEFSVVIVLGVSDVPALFFTYKLAKNGPVEIVDLPMKNGDFPLRYLNVYHLGSKMGTTLGRIRSAR